jgi:transcription elongation factor GreB
MRKGFTRKPQADEPATRVKNYITPSGLQRLKDEHWFLLARELPAVTEVVAWAASNGDRSFSARARTHGMRKTRHTFYSGPTLTTCCSLMSAEELPTLTFT